MLYSILKKQRLTQIILGFLFLLFAQTPLFASDTVNTMIYFTGIGCPHCAEVSPVLHERIQEDSKMMVIEYEIYQNTQNATVLNSYFERYGYQLAIPLALYSSNGYSQGDTDILKFDKSLNINKISLPSSDISWDDFNLNDLEGYPRIFTKDRVAIKDTAYVLSEEENNQLKTFLTTGDIPSYVSTLGGNEVTNLTVEDSGGSLVYDNGVKVGGWILLWKGDGAAQITDSTTDTTSSEDTTNQKLSWLKVGSLALTDSINPCALSVLLMMLIAIATYHPKDKKQILFSGLAFIAAVFVTYFIYGLLIVKAFQLVQSISEIRLYLYRGLGIVTIILGLLELKDFFFYKPGSLMTEMPMSFRPKVQKIIAKITSPIGAFGLGMFVTLFLLPCTIGPYIILGGILSFGDLFSSLPYLTVYNFIFIIPMLLIVLLVFFGSKNIKQVSEWREKNVRILHLIIGLVFLLLGISMLFGLF